MKQGTKESITGPNVNLVILNMIVSATNHSLSSEATMPSITVSHPPRISEDMSARIPSKMFSDMLEEVTRWYDLSFTVLKFSKAQQLGNHTSKIHSCVVRSGPITGCKT